MFTISTRNQFVIGGAAVVMSISAAAAVANQPNDDAAACEPFVGKIVESSDFTPYASQRSRLPDALLDTGGRDESVPPSISVESVNGIKRQWAIVTAGGSATQYFSTQELKSGASLWEFQESGGIELDSIPLESSGMTIEELADQLGTRASRVQVGDSDALVVWADPGNPSELRTHNVYWSDDQTSWALLANMSAEEAVTAAREVACR